MTKPKRAIILIVIIFSLLALRFFMENPSGKEPENAATYNDRGLQCQKLNQFGPAADNYRKAIELDSDGEAGIAAYRNLANLAESLTAAEESEARRHSEALMKTGMNYFDAGLAAYKNLGYEKAKNHIDLALSTIRTSRILDPDNHLAHGFMHLAKGFFYHICGAENIKTVNPGDSNYTTMGFLRKAYHSFAFAEAYYELAYEYLEEREFKDLIKSYEKENDYYIKKVVKRYLPGVDYWSKSYMKKVKKDVECALTIDRINEALVSGDYDEAVEIMEEFEKDLSKMKTGGNAESFYFLNLAYARLAVLVPNLSQGREWPADQKAQIEKELDGCLSDLKRARFGFKNDAYADLCDDLIIYVEHLETKQEPGIRDEYDGSLDKNVADLVRKVKEYEAKYGKQGQLKADLDNLLKSAGGKFADSKNAIREYRNKLSALMKRPHPGGIIPAFDGGAASVSIPTIEEVRQEEAKKIAQQKAAAATLEAIGTLAGEIYNAVE